MKISRLLSAGVAAAAAIILVHQPLIWILATVALFHGCQWFYDIVDRRVLPR
jgi:hypothetical protein